MNDKQYFLMKETLKKKFKYRNIVFDNFEMFELPNGVITLYSSKNNYNIILNLPKKGKLTGKIMHNGLPVKIL